MVQFLLKLNKVKNLTFKILAIYLSKPFVPNVVDRSQMELIKCKWLKLSKI